jgi:hypothetical protein
MSGDLRILYFGMLTAPWHILLAYTCYLTHVHTFQKKAAINLILPRPFFLTVAQPLQQKSDGLLRRLPPAARVVSLVTRVRILSHNFFKPHFRCVRISEERTINRRLSVCKHLTNISIKIYRKEKSNTICVQSRAA